MSSPESTTSGDVSGDAPKSSKLEQITFRFCSECSNMLYPKEDEDSHKLMFTCRTCQYTEEATSSCVFRNLLNDAVGETAGVTQDVGSDPTVCGPVPPQLCDVHIATAADATAATAATAAVPTAVASDNALALCLRCGITLLHCNRCRDPASVDEYNDWVAHHPDFAAHQTLCYIQLTNHWSAMDEKSRAIFEDRFMCCASPHISPSEETMAQYLPYDGALDNDDDPPEALGVEPTIHDDLLN